MSASSPCISSCSDPSSCPSVLHSSFRAPTRARGSKRRPADRGAGAAGGVGCRCAAGWRAAPWRARWCGGGTCAHAHPHCWCGGAAAGGGASLLGLGWDRDSSGLSRTGSRVGGGGGSRQNEEMMLGGWSKRPRMWGRVGSLAVGPLAAGPCEFGLTKD
jgi:hypothetical protein